MELAVEQAKKPGTPVPLPSAPHITLASNVSIQPPLSRRGHGPGLIIIDPGYNLPVEPSAGPDSQTLDPSPQYKWAEEGYAVVRLCVPAQGNATGWDAGRGGLGKAIEALRALETCDTKDKFGLIVYGTPEEYPPHFPRDLGNEIEACPSITPCVFFSASWAQLSVSRPTLIHHAGVSPGPNPVPDPVLFEEKLYTYPNVSSPDFVIPGKGGFSYTAASLAHSRTLKFVKDQLGGPWFDLEKIWEEHTYYEFEDRSVEKTMGTMVKEPYVNHIPTMTGGIGRERLANFYRHHFIWNNPEDTALELVSRTIGIDRIVDEFIFSFTHDTEIDWLIPGVPPTGIALRIPFVSIVNIRGDRLYHEHITWDQGTVLRQLGLLPEYLPFPYEVRGMEGQTLEVRVPVAGVDTARKLEDQRSVESNLLVAPSAACLRRVG